MAITIKPMDRTAAVDISHWTHDAPYDFYDSDPKAAVDEFPKRDILHGS